MRFCLLGLIACLFAAPALAAETCRDLHQRFEHENKVMAMSFADGIGETSAERVSLRRLEDLSSRTEQMILIEFMRSKNCPFPKERGSADDYVDAALGCRTARLRGEQDPLACDLSTWTRAR